MSAIAKAARQRAGDLAAAAETRAGRKAARRLGLQCLAATLVLGALSILYEVWKAPRLERSRRTSLSARADGFRGVFEVARSLGHATTRLMSSYGRLPPPDAAVLVILDPMPAIDLVEQGSGRLDESQVRSLERWISSGGRVVGSKGGRRFVQILFVEVETTGPDAELERWQGGDVRDAVHAVSAGGLPSASWVPARGRVAGSGSIAGFEDRWNSPPPRAELRVKAFLRGGEKGSLELEAFDAPLTEGFAAAAILDERPIVIEKAHGKGKVWLVSTSYPFTNLGIARGGTAPLVAAILDAASDGGSRSLVFDEYCHGLAPRKDILDWFTRTSLFYPMAASTLLLLAIAWRGAVRLGPPVEARTMPRRAKEEFVMSLADIALRARRHRAAARWILDAHRSILLGGKGGFLGGKGGFPGGTEASSGGASRRAEAPEIAALEERVRGAGTFREEDLRRFTRDAEDAFRELREGKTRKDGLHVPRR